MRAVGAVTAKMVPKKAAKPPQSQQSQNRMEFCCFERNVDSLCWPRHLSQRRVVLQLDSGKNNPSKAYYQDKVFMILLPMHLPHRLATDLSVKCNWERNK